MSEERDESEGDVNLCEELATAAGISVKSGESETSFAKRLAKAFSADNFPDDTWEAMSEPAQELANELVKAKGNNFPDLPGWEELASRVPDKPARATREKAPPAPPKEKRISSLYRTRQLLIHNPRASIEELVEKVTDEGLKISTGTVQSVKADFHAMVRVLKDEGFLKDLVIPTPESKEMKEAAE